jgi:single-strand DNA-binding protein
MASFNKITIVGYLGKDPELRYTGNGNAVCGFSVATTEKRGDQETTTWFKVSAWGKQAELCNEYLHKGSQVYIEGRVRMEDYTDRDGNKRYNLEVNATDIRFLSRKSDNGNARDEAPSPEDKQARRDALNSQQGIEPDDLPF